MAFREKIELVVDIVSGNAKGALGQLRTDLDATDGAFNKLKVAGSGALDFIKQNALGFGLAASAAITGFAVKAVGDFQEVALGAGQMSSSLGVSTEEASRLREVFADLGIGVSTAERGIGRMNREIDKSPEKFAAIGAEIARTKSGTVDVTQTFLNVIDAINAIEDPTRRAAAAQDVLGRGWQDMSRLIALGADGVANALARVETAKIMTPADVARAEKFRDTMDELKGVLESVSLTVGERVVPLVSAAGDAILAVKSALDELKASLPEGQAGDEFWTFLTGSALDQVKRVPALISQLAGQIEDLGEPTITASVAMGKLGDAADFTGGEFQSAGDEAATLTTRVETLAETQARGAEVAKVLHDVLGEVSDALIEQTSAMRGAADATIAASEAQEDFAAAARESALIQLDAKKATDEKAEAVDAERDAMIKAADAAERLGDEQATASGATRTATQKLDDFNRSLIGNATYATPAAQQAIVDYIAEVNGIPPEKATEILAAIRAGDIPRAEALLASASRNREATIIADAQTAAAEADLNYLARARTARVAVSLSTGSGGNQFMKAEAGGTNSGPGGAILVGEEGPEIVQLPAGHRTIPAEETSRILANSGSGGTPLGVGGGGSVINVTVTSADPNAVVRAIETYVKRNGPGVIRKWSGS